ncbi:BgTH12-02140 [Blumeria graminis f. sp. triticale]|nr:BgTH12-02140 [Blumeria graminis f. sp. triticale]
MHLNFLLASLILATGCDAASTCWYPDGVTSDPSHVPCNQTINTASACCNSHDACSSGLCVSMYGAYRGTCTDQSWNSPNCGSREWPQCITDPSTRRKYSQSTSILPCASPGTQGESYCCSYSNGSSCCNDQFRLGNSGPIYKPGLDIMLNDISSSSGSNTTNITNVPSSAGQDIATKVGLGVGIPLGVFVVGLLGFLFYRESHKNSNERNPAAASLSLVNSRTRHLPMEQNDAYESYSSPQSYPVSETTQHHPYSPHNLKPDPVFEAPVSNLHEMRG